jgi:hypothetical protein
VRGATGDGTLASNDGGPAPFEPQTTNAAVSGGDAFRMSGRQAIRCTIARLSAFDLACLNRGTADSVSSVRQWWQRRPDQMHSQEAQCSR